MNNKRLTYMPSADGFVILNSEEPISAKIAKFFLENPYHKILRHPYRKYIDQEKTDLLYEQLSPTQYKFTPDRFSNEFKDDKTLSGAIRKLKNRYPGIICYFQDEWIADDMLPEFAKKIGIRFILKPVFRRIKYQKNKDGKHGIRYFGSLPDNIIECVISSTNFDIEFNKCILAVSPKDAPTINEISDELQNIYRDTSLSPAQQKSEETKLLKRCTPAERAILKEIYYYDEDIHLKSIIWHELKHVINEVLLTSRHAKSECGKLNAQQMLQLFIHDEISASSQEILVILGDLYQGKKVSDASEAERLSPIHYQKFIKADRTEKAKMLQNPHSIVREISQNWMKKRYQSYEEQFNALFANIRDNYPAYLWSDDKNNNPDEYLLQKRLTYSLEVHNPVTNTKTYINCSNAVTDQIFPISRNLRTQINLTNRAFEIIKKDVQKSGLDDELIAQARKRNEQYIRTYKSAKQQEAHLCFEQLLEQYRNIHE